MTRAVVFLPNWLGDVVMATPTLRALRRHLGPDAQLVGLGRPYLADLLAGTGWLDEYWAFDPRAKDPAQRRTAIVRRMRGQRCDLALLLTNSLSTGLMAWLGGARQRVGYARYGRGLLLSHPLQPTRENGHIAARPMVDYYLALAAAAGCPPESPRLELAVTPQEQQLADTALRELGLGQRGGIVALNSSGAYGAAKLWPAEHFARLARLIVDELDHDVLVVCGPQERDLARHIVRQAGRRRVAALADQPVSIGLSKGCLQRCRLLVTTDSGPRHVAAALGKPVVTLFGPTSPTWVANPTVAGRDLRIALDCMPCAKRVCPLKHHRCMRELHVDTVFDAVTDWLRRPSTAAA